MEYYQLANKLLLSISTGFINPYIYIKILPGSQFESKYKLIKW